METETNEEESSQRNPPDEFGEGGEFGTEVGAEISDSDDAFSDDEVGDPASPRSEPSSAGAETDSDPDSDSESDSDPGSPETTPAVEPDEFSTPNGPENSELNFESTGESVEAPKVGRIYGDDAEIGAHYLKYAKQQGFGITRAAAGTNVKKEVKNVTWRCECQGVPDARRNRKIQAICNDDGVPVIVRTRKSKLSKKVGCKAKVYAAKEKDGSWVIKTVILDHNGHIPTPKVSKHIIQHRKESLNGPVKRKLFNHMHSGLSVPHAANVMVHERHGFENMEVTETDLRNEVAKERKLKLKDGDANAMMEYFKNMYADNQSFYCQFRWDKKGAVKDVLWVDARSRAAYEEFGDVVCFDTTYLTNKYDLPFANFIGVNHHGQSILLGCALISNENCETFEWLFDRWLHCMNGKAPDAILTDQAAPFRKPLKDLMPKTHHRWCLWHIMTKFGKKLSKYANYEDFKHVLKDIVYESLSEKEFDERWEAAMVEFDLGECKWLKYLYLEKAMWVPAYQMDTFWAGMKSTQRVESIHSFFDKYLKKHTRLSEFVQHYCRALEKRTLREVKADYQCRRVIRQLNTDFMVERYFQKIYTDAKFALVQEECAGVLYCNGRGEKQLSDNMVEHVIEDRLRTPLQTKDPLNALKAITIEKPRKKRLYLVKFDTVTHDVFCECKSFETKGIMCRHSIRVYDLHDVGLVPEKYILRRWRKDVKRKHSRVKVAYHDPLKCIDVKRYDNMVVAFENVAVKAMDNEHGKEIVMALIGMMELRLTELASTAAAGRVSTTSVDPLLLSDRQTLASDSLADSVGALHSGHPLYDHERTQESFVAGREGLEVGDEADVDNLGEGGLGFGDFPNSLIDPPSHPEPIYRGKKAKSGRRIGTGEASGSKKKRKTNATPEASTNKAARPRKGTKGSKDTMPPPVGETPTVAQDYADGAQNGEYFAQVSVEQLQPVRSRFTRGQLQTNFSSTKLPVTRLRSSVTGRNS